MPADPIRKNAPQQPWYARYHFRFDALRLSGAIITYRTFIPALSEAGAHAALVQLLGEGERYRIAFEGISDIPMAMWPLHYRLECGLDKNGVPVPKPASTPEEAKPAARKPKAKA